MSFFLSAGERSVWRLAHFWLFFRSFFWGDTFWFDRRYAPNLMSFFLMNFVYSKPYRKNESKINFTHWVMEKNFRVHIISDTKSFSFSSTFKKDAKPLTANKRFLNIAHIFVGKVFLTNLHFLGKVFFSKQNSGWVLGGCAKSFLLQNIFRYIFLLLQDHLS